LLKKETLVYSYLVSEDDVRTESAQRKRQNSEIPQRIFGRITNSTDFSKS